MIHFAQAQYLILLLLIPVFYLMYGIFLRIKKKRLEKFGEKAIIEQLMPAVSKGRGWLKITFFSIAFFFFVIGLCRVQLGARLKEKESKGVEVIVALDVSNSMLAKDYSPNRLERAKLAISRIVDKMQEDRIGLVVFAGESFIQLPITTDYVSAKVFLNSINTESVPVQGTDLSEAIMTSARSFSTQSENSRAIILISDGEDHEGSALDAAAAVAQEGIKIYTIGVGSPAGEPIPLNGELMKDKDGNIVVTKLNEQILMEIAEQGNGEYVRASNSEFGLNPILEDIKSMDKKDFNSVVFEDFNEQFMYFFAIALLFLILEFLISDKKSGKNIFN